MFIFWDFIFLFRFFFYCHWYVKQLKKKRNNNQFNKIQLKTDLLICQLMSAMGYLN